MDSPQAIRPNLPGGFQVVKSDDIFVISFFGCLAVFIIASAAVKIWGA